MCVLGKRLLKDIDVLANCTKYSAFLNSTFCGGDPQGYRCDSYYTNNTVTIRNGIRGLASGVFFG